MFYNYYLITICFGCPIIIFYIVLLLINLRYMKINLKITKTLYYLLLVLFVSLFFMVIFAWRVYNMLNVTSSKILFEKLYMIYIYFIEQLFILEINQLTLICYFFFIFCVIILFFLTLITVYTFIKANLYAYHIYMLLNNTYTNKRVWLRSLCLTYEVKKHELFFYLHARFSDKIKETFWDKLLFLFNNDFFIFTFVDTWIKGIPLYITVYEIIRYNCIDKIYFFFPFIFFYFTIKTVLKFLQLLPISKEPFLNNLTPTDLHELLYKKNKSLMLHCVSFNIVKKNNNSDDNKKTNNSNNNTKSNLKNDPNNPQNANKNKNNSYNTNNEEQE